jgi:DNA polymerase sigma
MYGLAGMKDVKMLSRARVPTVKMRDPVRYARFIFQMCTTRI